MQAFHVLRSNKIIFFKYYKLLMIILKKKSCKRKYKKRGRLIYIPNSILSIKIPIKYRINLLKCTINFFF